MKKKNYGKTNRNKGNNYERELAKTFRNMGYSYCKTSRQASRLYDDSGFDLWGLPYLIQAKCGYEKSRIKPDVQFRKMNENLIKNFPPNSLEHGYIKAVFNKINGYKSENHLVTFEYKDIIKILAKIHEYENLLSAEELKKIEENINNTFNGK